MQSFVTGLNMENCMRFTKETKGNNKPEMGYVGDAAAAVGARYVPSELITKAGKPFTEEKFLKDCMLQETDILCPEQKRLFNNISLSANTVAEPINNLSSDIYGQLRDKVRFFTAYSVVLGESTDETNNAQVLNYARPYHSKAYISAAVKPD